MIGHANNADLEQYISGLLSAYDSSVVYAHLTSCEECQGKLAEIAMASQWGGPEKRGEPRVKVDFPGRLKLLDPVTSVGPPHDVKVLEISRGGLKIQTPRYLIPKTLVQIGFNGKNLLGQVRYCTRFEGVYRAGLKQVQNFPAD